MADRKHSNTLAGAALTAFAGLAGAAIALYLYLAPLTGVTGTVGALIVLGAAALVALGAILHYATENAVWRWLTILGALGTGIAAAFLHAWWVVAAMGLALLGMFLTIIASRTGSEGRAKGAAA